MDLREERIKEMELETRQLHEEIVRLKEAVQQADDRMQEAHARAAKIIRKEWDTYIAPRDARILELERENNACRKREATALATIRQKQDEYDTMCTKFGAEMAALKP